MDSVFSGFITRCGDALLESGDDVDLDSVFSGFITRRGDALLLTGKETDSPSMCFEFKACCGLADLTNDKELSMVEIDEPGSRDLEAAVVSSPAVHVQFVESGEINLRGTEASFRFVGKTVVSGVTVPGEITAGSGEKKASCDSVGSKSVASGVTIPGSGGTKASCSSADKTVASGVIVSSSSSE